MGLDMYAYSAARAGQNRDYWDQDLDPKDGEVPNLVVSKPKEIAYWRKHPNLHGYFERLWTSNCSEEDRGLSFNGIELELTWEDLDALEREIEQGALPETTGFFFGDSADEYYKETDLKFIREARSDLFLGLKVFYNSSW